MYIYMYMYMYVKLALVHLPGCRNQMKFVSIMKRLAYKWRLSLRLFL